MAQLAQSDSVQVRRILCLGDSNTYGYDPRSYLGSRYDEQVRWTGRLQRKDREIINGGANGASVPHPTMLPGLLDWVQSKQPLTAITVMLGSNDLLLGDSVEAATERMEALLRRLLEQVEREQLLLLAPPTMQLGDWVPNPGLVEASRRLAHRYEALASQLQIPFADTGKWGIDLCFDGVHFSPAGHERFAEELEKLLEKMGW